MGGGVFLVFPIPFPFIYTNTCKEQFRVKADLEKTGIHYKNIMIKYDGKIHIPVRKNEVGNPIFQINTDELKQAKDAVIIVKDGNEVIAELPFEWGVSVYV